MKRAWILQTVAVLSIACGPGAPPETPPASTESTTPEPMPSAGSIERVDPGLDDLISVDAVIEHLADGFAFAEGPVWVTSGGPFLLFSDIPGNRSVKWAPDGTVSDFLNPVFDGEYEEGSFVGSNGVTVGPNGDIVIAEHFGRRISRIASDGTRSVVVDSYDGRRLNSPNDLAYKSNGSLYFTDPPYGLPSQDDREIEGNGIYRLGTDGTLTHLGDQAGPNGTGFSPDESRLYVADSIENIWMAYEVGEDGTLDEGTLFFDASQSGESGAADGLKLDDLGNVWATGPGGVWVFAPDGRHLGTIRPAEVPANVAWGDDGRTLYMTARTGLYLVRTLVSGPIP